MKDRKNTERKIMVMIINVLIYSYVVTPDLSIIIIVSYKITSNAYNASLLLDVVVSFFATSRLLSSTFNFKLKE